MRQRPRLFRTVPYTAFLVTSALFFEPLAAQGSDWTQGSEGTIGRNYSLAPIAFPNPTPYGRATTLDLDGDLMLDHAVLAGGELRVLFAPGLFEAPANGIQFNVAGLAALRTRTGDSLLTASASGVRRYSWEDSAIVSVLIHPAGSKCVRPFETQPGAPIAIASLSADGTSIFRLTERPEAPNATWESQLIYTSAAEVLDMRIADLGGDGVQEICLQLPGGVEIISPSQPPVSVVSPTLRTTAMAVLGNPGGEQWLVATLANPASENSDELIVVLDESGLVDSVLISNGPGFVGIEGGETSEIMDGTPDASFTHGGAFEVLQFSNLAEPGEDPDFALHQELALSIIDSTIAPPIAPHAAWPTISDIDNDADADTILPITSNGSIFVHLGAQVNESLQKPSIVQDSSLRFVAGATIQLQMGVTVDPAEIVQGAPNALELLIYRRLSVNDPVQALPVVADIIPFSDATATTGTELRFDCVAPLAEVPGEYSCTTFDSMYWIVVRTVAVVDIDGETVVQQRFPARLYGVEGQLTSSSNLDFITSHQSAGAEMLAIVHDCTEGDGHPVDQQPFGHGTGQTASEIGGSGIELPCLPGPVGGGTVPKPSKD